MEHPPDFLYWYRAEIVSVYDGDTVYANIDLGCGIWNKGADGRGEGLRLFGIDAPELRGDEKEKGYAARDFLCELLTGKPVDQLEKDGRRLVVNADVRINTIKDEGGKYGRLLAKIYVERDGEWSSVADALVAAGHAVRKDY